MENVLNVYSVTYTFASKKNQKETIAALDRYLNCFYNSFAGYNNIIVSKELDGIPRFTIGPGFYSLTFIITGDVGQTKSDLEDDINLFLNKTLEDNNWLTMGGCFCNKLVMGEPSRIG